VTQVVKAPDGRRLSVETVGAFDGKPVFLLHGTPGGRYGPRPRGIVLYRLGVRLISYDRPGYSESDRHPGRTVADAASDVAAIADALGLDQFGVVGRSGGAPHALGCAALLPGQVTCAAALCSLAPYNAAGLAWNFGMADSNVRAYREAGNDLAALMAKLDQHAVQIRRDPESLLRLLWPELVNDDRKVIGDMAIRRIIAQTHAEALRETADGWIDDVVALRSPWGFDPSAIEIPVKLWHGGDDVFSPASHTRWLADHIPGSELEVQDGVAHFGSVGILPRILFWAAARMETGVPSKSG
jgi:pimeloyl-ACP methyl ester carboxylesterase